eukprot:CRZ01777.1 hypothetical protein [Spongospora subterranea]
MQWDPTASLPTSPNQDATADSSAETGTKLEGNPSPGGQRQFSEKGRQFLKGRFTSEEKERLRKAVIEYVEANNLGLDGIQLLCAKERRPELRGAWASIASCVPHRSVSSCYHFCTRAFATRATGRWTEQDIDLLREMVAKHGRKWTLIGTLIKRLPCSCRDKWRLIEKKNIWTLSDDNMLVCNLMTSDSRTIRPIGKHSQEEATKRWKSRYRDLIESENRHILRENDITLLNQIVSSRPRDSLDIRWQEMMPIGDWPALFCMWRWEILSRYAKGITHEGPVQMALWLLENMPTFDEQVQDAGIQLERQRI